jgi:hypothetical protein
MPLFYLKITLATCLLLIVPGSVWSQDHALTVYGGRVTDERWLEALSFNAELLDANILVTALSWTVKHFHGGLFTLEFEGQVAKYFGDQKHFEFNIPLALRWHRPIRTGSMSTSLAFGMGPSWAAEDPEVELMTHDSTQQFLVYWFLEIALGRPDSQWAGVFRLHHRSTGFGAVADDGGSNTLAAGVKYRF